MCVDALRDKSFFVSNFMLMAQYVDSKRKQLDNLSKMLKTSKYVCVAYIFEHIFQYCWEGGASPLGLNFSVAFGG